MRNESLINKRKRGIVQKICDISAKTPFIKRVIIFGSSVTDQCQDNSDIDVCFDISCNVTDDRFFEFENAVGEICNYNCDVIVYPLTGTNLKKEINDKGVIVYES